MMLYTSFNMFKHEELCTVIRLSHIFLVDNERAILHCIICIKLCYLNNLMVQWRTEFLYRAPREQFIGTHKDLTIIILLKCAKRL